MMQYFSKFSMLPNTFLLYAILVLQRNCSDQFCRLDQQARILMSPLIFYPNDTKVQEDQEENYSPKSYCFSCLKSSSFVDSKEKKDYLKSVFNKRCFGKMTRVENVTHKNVTQENAGQNHTHGSKMKSPKYMV